MIRDPLTMSLHASNRLESLVNALASVVSDPLSSPFVPETVIVPSRALGVWLSLELAKQHGVWANSSFLTPRAWLDRLTLAADAGDPFQPGALAWSIAAALPAHLSQPAFAEIKGYLVDDDDGTKRLALAGRIARTFDTYLMHRPDLVTRWEAGTEDHWQARLFRTLLARHGSVHVATRTRQLVDTLAVRTDLPERLCLFDVGTLPPTVQRVVDALSSRVPVHVFTLDRAAGKPFESGTMLATLQRATPGARKAINPPDRTFSVHACHSPMRECEVLRDQLLAFLQDDRTLQPRDILVLCPDLETYAPLVDAVFGVKDDDPLHLPFRVVDRSAGAALPVFDATIALLHTVSSRMTAPEVVDLLALAPVRSKFGISEDDIERIRGWVDEAGIRWAVDADHRAEVGQPALALNTWRFGLDRLIVGYAMGKDGDTLFQGTLPYDDVEGSSASPLGGLAAFCETLFALRKELAQPATVEVWRDRIADAVDRMVRPHWSTEYQKQIVRESLDAMASHAEAAGFTEAMPLAVVRDALQADLSGRGSQFTVSSGSIRFASLSAGRPTPARIVALLGMNDGTFPRRSRPMGFDLMTASPEPGDPSPRDEDRQVFDEAVLSARDRLVVTYIGRSIKNDAERPPSVVVSDLLDTIDASFLPPGKDPLPSTRVVVRHALHAFSPRYFRDPGGPLFSHAEALCTAARAMQGERSQSPAFVRAAIAEPPKDELERVMLDDLCSFFGHATKGFVQRRLGVNLGSDMDVLADREPFEVAGLDRYAVQSALVERARKGERVSIVPLALAASGELPPGTIGEVAYDGMHEQPGQMGRTVAELLGTKAPAPVDVDLVLDDGTRITGSLRSVGRERQVLYRFAKAPGKLLVDAWIRHLALRAVDRPIETILLVRGKDEIQRFRIGKVDRPQQELSELVALYLLGRRLPIPLFADVSDTFAAKIVAGSTRTAAMNAARFRWDNGFAGRQDPYVLKVYGERDPLAPDFQLLGDGSVELPSFAQLAMDVFGRLRKHLQVIA